MPKVHSINLLLSAVFLSLAGSTFAARFVVESSQVRFNADGFTTSFPSAIGDFGIPNYGAIMVGQIAYISSNAAGCSEFYSALPPGTDVLLVDRGSCFFIEKAYHAQKAGAKAVIVTDNISEDLLTMASPENLPELAPMMEQLAIPTVLITKEAGDQIKYHLERSKVTVELDWSESIAHGSTKVQYEYWFTTNDVCGEVCKSQQTFFTHFKDIAISLEQQGFTQFTPHVMLRSCQWGGVDCNRDCIRNGRYCSVEPIPGPFSNQYTGADVVESNTRHLCAFQVANSTDPGGDMFWDFASKFAAACRMEAGTFTADCAKQQLQLVGIDVNAVESCVGYRGSDNPHELLEAQIRAQNDEDNTGRGRVVMIPTIVINFDQYRGSLTAAGVLRALCSGFSEGSEPSTCLTGGLEVDECAAGTHGCWTKGELSACVDTFRGFACRCPAGWEGNGHTCVDVDECALGISGCDQICVNDPGTYHCECNKGYTLHGGQGGPGMCLPDNLGGASGRTALPGWFMVLLFCACVASVSIFGIAYTRWRLRQAMQGEIRGIMREYMPLPADEMAARSLESSRTKAPAGPGVTDLSQTDYASQCRAPILGGRQGRGDTQLTPLAGSRRINDSQV